MPLDFALYDAAMVKALLGTYQDSAGLHDADPIVPVYTTHESLREHPPLCDAYHTTLSVAQKNVYEHEAAQQPHMYAKLPIPHRNFFPRASGDYAAMFVGVSESTHHTMPS
eukprot:gene411-769_t